MSAYATVYLGLFQVPEIPPQEMVSYTEARKKKERFRKYRQSLEAKAKKSMEHRAKIWILLERNDKFYPISGCSKNVSAFGRVFHIAYNC